MSKKIRLILMIAAFGSVSQLYAGQAAASCTGPLDACSKACCSKKESLKNCLQACKKKADSTGMTQQQAADTRADIIDYDTKPTHEELPYDPQLDNQIYPFGSVPLQNDPGDPTGKIR